jgi:hypothetical protein
MASGPMLSLPQEAQFLEQFRAVFGEPTFRRVLLLCVGAIVADGRRTVSRLLWVVRALRDGHASSYHRVFSRAKWSALAAARVLAGLVVAAAGQGPLRLVVDDTTEQRRGDHVYGKGTHRDAVRSSRSHVIHLFGLKWVVLAVLVNFPFSTRPWALPVLAVLYRSKALDAREGRRHKTPTELARGLAALMLRWFPGRSFILLGDGGYAGCGLACFCNRRRGRLALVSRFHPDAALYRPPPPPTGKRGRPARKGAKLPTPRQAVESSKPEAAAVDWYGGRKRDVLLTAGGGLWYSHRGGRIVPVKWVHVADAKNPSRRQEYFYSTDTALPAGQLVGFYTGRWPIEVTIEEAKQRLGLGGTRQYKKPSVLRATPCILALYSLVSLAFAARCRTHRSQLSPRPGPHPKRTASFSDALACVRRMLWAETILERLPGARLIRKIPRTFTDTVLDLLADVA